MAGNAKWKGLPVPQVAATLAVALLAVLFTASWWREPAAPERPQAEAPAPSASPAPSAAPPAAPTPGLARYGVGSGEEAAPAPEPEALPGEDANQPYPVDLEALRARLPDNLYWELAVPTKDPEVLKRREDDALRWNDLYGKVLSGTATEAEIHTYYEHRRQVSEDFIAFANLVLTEYGERLPERDRGLYELSIDMHRTRLAELPRQVSDALARRQTQEQRREAWRRGQQQP